MIYGWEWTPAVAPLLQQIDQHAEAQQKLQIAQEELESIRMAMEGLSIKPGLEARMELENSRKAAEAKLEARTKEVEDMMANLSVSFPRTGKQRVSELQTKAFMTSVGDKRKRETSGSPGTKPKRSMSVL